MDKSKHDTKLFNELNESYQTPRNRSLNDVIIKQLSQSTHHINNRVIKPFESNDPNKKVLMTRKIDGKVVETVILEFLNGATDKDIDLPLIQKNANFEIEEVKQLRQSHEDNTMIKDQMPVIEANMMSTKKDDETLLHQAEMPHPPQPPAPMSYALVPHWLGAYTYTIHPI